jgi:serine/threonine protein kinase
MNAIDLTHVNSFEQAKELLDSLNDEQLFGTGRSAEEKAAARFNHRTLARLTHPDAQKDERVRKLAANTFVKLGDLWATYTAKRDGKTPPKTAITEVRTRKGTYTLGSKLRDTSIASVYKATLEDASGDLDTSIEVHITRNVRDNDLLRNEADALRTLAKEGDKAFLAYGPEILDTFILRDATSNEDRHAWAGRVETGLVSLKDVMKAYPNGIDPKDAAWMFRRLLMAVGWGNRAGLVHGAILPASVLIQPDDHGLVLDDWAYSTPLGGTLTAVPNGTLDSYPFEVTNKQPVSAATDIYMSVKLISELMGDKATPPLRAFIKGSTQKEQKLRPDDAWALKEELDELLYRMWGERKFRPFYIPS